MANRTDKEAAAIRGTNPQHLVEKITRSKIYNSMYWKEHCFAVDAETIVDRCMELKAVGGVLSIATLAHDCPARQRGTKANTVLSPGWRGWLGGLTLGQQCSQGASNPEHMFVRHAHLPAAPHPHEPHRAQEPLAAPGIRAISSACCSRSSRSSPRTRSSQSTSCRRTASTCASSAPFICASRASPTRCALRRARTRKPPRRASSLSSRGPRHRTPSQRYQQAHVSRISYAKP